MAGANTTHVDICYIRFLSSQMIQPHKQLRSVPSPPSPLILRPIIMLRFVSITLRYADAAKISENSWHDLDL